MNALRSLGWVPFALDRKLLRDLARLWSQALTIALVVASGIGGFIISLNAVDSLALARERFYAQGRFADVFATVKRAPNALAERLYVVPGVADLQVSTEHLVRGQVEGVSDPILGRLIGLDNEPEPRMNRVFLQAGRRLQAGQGNADLRTDTRIEALVSAGFAQARKLKPGDQLVAIINGRLRTFGDRRHRYVAGVHFRRPRGRARSARFLGCSGSTMRLSPPPMT